MRAVRWGLVPGVGDAARQAARADQRPQRDRRGQEAVRRPLRARRPALPGASPTAGTSGCAPRTPSSRGSRSATRSTAASRSRSPGCSASRKIGEDWVTSATILTTRANEVCAPVHDRMPVVLAGPDEEAAWLAGADDPELFAPLAAAAHDGAAGQPGRQPRGGGGSGADRAAAASGARGAADAAVRKPRRACGRSPSTRAAAPPPRRCARAGRSPSRSRPGRCGSPAPTRARSPAPPRGGTARPRRARRAGRPASRRRCARARPRRRAARTRRSATRRRGSAPAGAPSSGSSAPSSVRATSNQPISGDGLRRISAPAAAASSCAPRQTPSTGTRVLQRVAQQLDLRAHPRQPVRVAHVHAAAEDRDGVELGQRRGHRLAGARDPLHELVAVRLAALREQAAGAAAGMPNAEDSHLGQESGRVPCTRVSSSCSPASCWRRVSRPPSRRAGSACPASCWCSASAC